MSTKLRLKRALRQGRAVRAWGFRPAHLFDVHHIATVAGQPVSVIAGANASAADRVLRVLRDDPDVQRRFPTALTDGSEGPFAQFLRQTGPEGLTPQDVDAAFAVPHETQAALAVQIAGLRDSDPATIFHPRWRGPLIRLLFRFVAAGRLPHAAAWWAIIALQEAPLRGVHWAWATSPDLQAAHPEGPTRFGWRAVVEAQPRWHGVAGPCPDILDPADQIRLAWHASPEWRAAFPDALENADGAAAFLGWLATAHPDRDLRDWIGTLDHGSLSADLARPGFTLLAHASYASGLQVSALSLATAGVPVALRNVPVERRRDAVMATPPALAPAVHPVTVIHVQPGRLFDQVYPQAALALPAHPTRRVGFWYWELETIPDDMVAAAATCDEVWTGSDFIAAALRARIDKPVHVILPGLQTKETSGKTRAEFDLPAQNFVAAFTFNMMSVTERKNPLGLIRAFQMAFDRSEPATLVLKTSFGVRHPDALKALHRAADGYDIRIIDAIWPHGDVMALMACADAYVSLHRSEGLGLTLAEAMALGTPTIATRYSGNLSFMDDSNSLLVDAARVAVGPGHAPYDPAMIWADPDLEAAAEALRRLYEDRAFAKDLGRRGQASVRQRLSPDRMARDLADAVARAHKALA